MSEIEYLDQISSKVQEVFALAVEARDGAQSAIEVAQSIKADILRRKIELQRAELGVAKEGRVRDG